MPAQLLHSAHPPQRTDWIAPAAGVLYTAAAIALGTGGSAGLAVSLLLVPVLLAVVFSAVHHAEAIAHGLGEPLGTLVLTFAITVIEVALIVSIMLGEEPKPALARDTVFAVVMIICNGIVGACLLVGGLRHHHQTFAVRGAALYISVLIAMAVLTLVLPNATRSAPGSYYAPSQLLFVSVVTLALYAAFLYVQTVRHVDYFQPTGAAEAAPAPSAPAGKLASPGLARHVLILLVGLAVVVLLSKTVAAVATSTLARVGAPPEFTGVLVALVVLLPESITALRAAWADELQRSLNLALGSSLATIGLTIPTVAVLSLVLDQRIELGLSQKDVTLLACTFAISVLTFSQPRTNVLSGFVHLVLFATFVFLVFAP